MKHACQYALELYCVFWQIIFLQTMDDMKDLINNFNSTSELLGELSLVTKIILSVLALSTVFTLIIVSERIAEHKKYSDRKIWVGQAQRNLNKRLPPIQSVAPRVFRSNRNENLDDLESVV